MSSISLTTLLHISRSGMLSQQFDLDAVANNIANVNTTGYKQTRAGFQELLSDAITNPPTGDSRNLGQAAGTMIVSNRRFFEQGNIQASEQPWDLAIEGEGFFQVQRPDGSIIYTRDGTFKLDGEGNLVTADGYFLYPRVTIPPDTEESLVSARGEVMVRRTGETNPQVVATISLAKFANPAGLEDIGDNGYQVTDVSGPAQTATPQTNGMGQIIGKALESSNVDLSNEFVEMIGAQRAYALMARSMSISDQMLSMVSQMSSGS